MATPFRLAAIGTLLLAAAIGEAQPPGTPSRSEQG